jgi:hypothetical protein
VFKNLIVRRDAKVAAAAAVVMVGIVLLATQTAGRAAAVTVAEKDWGWECEQGTACLWNNAKNPGYTAERLVIRPSAAVWTPDLESSTNHRLGIVRSTTAAFHDNISQGVNRLPFDLCLIDTQSTGNGEYESNGPVFSVPAKSGHFEFAYKGVYNDSFDTYTTARPGDCPSYIRFRGADSHVLEVS